MPPRYDTEFDRLLERVRSCLGASADAELGAAAIAVNQALVLRPDSVDAWILKCQVCSATGDDVSALAAVEMAVARASNGGRAECLYWRGAVLGDLGRHPEALRAIEDAIAFVTDEDGWLLEDLYYEKVIVLEALGLGDTALAACDEGLARCPGSALLRAARAPAERARVRALLGVVRGGAGS